MINNLIKYNDGEIEVSISIKEDTIWLSQKQISELFDKDIRTINEHIKAIYKENELCEESTIRKFRIVQKEGNREVSRDISHYNLQIKQGIFYDGQIFDAYIFVHDLLKSAKKEVILIDNYIDESVLTIFSKYPKISFTIVTKAISKKLKLDIEKYNAQHKSIQLKTSNSYHDRFLIIDDNEVYHLGASLKDLAKKVFAFNKMDVNSLELLGKLK
jgi:hypothetical protein